MFLVALLSFQGCAVNKQGGITQLSLDTGELTANVIQELQTANGKAVLRRLPNGQYQLKLYDRNRIIDLGYMTTPFVDFIAKINDYDLISVGDGTKTCTNTHKLVQIKGYDVYSWDFNNGVGRCDLPLAFAVEGQSWKITQQVLNADRQIWTWTAGRLSTNYERFTPAFAVSNQGSGLGGAPLPGSNNDKSKVPALSAPMTATTAQEKKNPFEGAGFESGGAEAQKRPRANTSIDKKNGYSSASATMPAQTDSPPALKTPRTALPRILEGIYSKPSASSDTEIAPIHVKLGN